MKYSLVNNLKNLTTPVPDFNFLEPPVDPLELGKDLLEVLYNKRGVGLAANQCGLPYRCFVMIGSPADFVVFNPTIVNTSSELIEGEEGCLSFPGLSFNLKRPKDIRIRFTIPSGQRITIRMEGMTARVAIHEVMHLNGKLFFEGISRLKLQRAVQKAKKYGFNYDGMGLFAYCE